MRFYILFTACILLTFLTQCSYDKEGDKIYTEVDEQPEFPEGIAALFQYLNKNFKYPKEATEKTCGAMVIKFIIEKDGATTLVDCQFSNCKLDCPEIKQAFKNMPKWKAGRKNGKPVRVVYTLPIKTEKE